MEILEKKAQEFANRLFTRGLVRVYEHIPVVQSAVVDLLQDEGVEHEFNKLLDAAEQAVNNPTSRAAQTVLKNAVNYYRNGG